MTIITESELREYWQNGRGQLPPFPSGTRFTDSAREFLQQLSLHPPAPVGTDDRTHAHPDWDKPATFPVILSGPVPVCAVCGQPIRNKPDHMSQLDANHFASKTAPRLVLRGRVDSLHALVLLAAVRARNLQLGNLALNLDTLAAYCREILSAEYHLRPVAPLLLMGKSEEELHDISHWPDRHLGTGHVIPGPQDPEMLHWLNVCRTQAREVEVVALETFGADRGPDPSGIGKNLSHAFNRFSSAVYVLELYFKAGRL